MAKTIIQKIVFKNLPIATLYNTYMNAKEHSASVGVIAKIQNKQGAKFSAHDSYVTREKSSTNQGQIVQSWRASDWSKSDVDSTFILLLEQMGNNSIITMVHANVLDRHFAGVKEGWDDYYWKPWKKYFAEKTKK